jgi:hypothetical protein
VSGARYRLESDGTILVLVTGARFTTNELSDVVKSAFDDPAVRPPVKLLLDSRGSRENASAEEVQRRVSMFGSRLDLFVPRVAVVVSDDLHHGIARIGAALVEEYSVNLSIFRNFDEAFRWLDAL